MATSRSFVPSFLAGLGVVLGLALVAYLALKTVVIATKLLTLLVVAVVVLGFVAYLFVKASGRRRGE